MKKIYLLLALTLVFATTSCSSENSNTQSNKVETSQEGSQENNLESSDSTKEEVKEELDINDVATIEITGKENIAEDINNGIFSDRVNLAIQVTNNSDKQLKGISGTLEIKDMFDKSILKMNCNLTGQIIDPNTVATFDSLGMDINEFMSEHVKFYNEKYEDLKFNYIINDVVYYDANLKNETINKSPRDSKVLVSIQSKENINEDIMNGIYSPRVNFSFKLSNLTDKDIKGIQGLVTIKDMFGNQVKKSNCDFTGETIPANGEITFEDLGFDVNEFMSEDVLLFTTSYDDLTFEYETTAIVYSDGTTE